jgi:hypothetical protein
MNHNFIDISGFRSGKLVAMSVTDKRTSTGCAIWLCKCDCGNSCEIRGEYIKRGHTKSCGCINKPHGMTDTKTWISWKEMIRRCYNKNNDRYSSYGGRGIIVCERWLASFVAFYDDMGERPEGKTLDRKDNNGNYEPANCKWSTASEQQQNTRKNKLWEINGVVYRGVVEASSALGISPEKLRGLLRRKRNPIGHAIAAEARVRELEAKK